MSYQNTGKPNGRPPNTERNQQIIADVKSGIPIEEVAEKYGLEIPYTRKIASENARKERVKNESEEVVYGTGLYSARDEQMKKLYASLNTKGALSKLHIQDMGKINAGYTRKSA